MKFSLRFNPSYPSVHMLSSFDELNRRRIIVLCKGWKKPLKDAWWFYRAADFLFAFKMLPCDTSKRYDAGMQRVLSIRRAKYEVP